MAKEIERKFLVFGGAELFEDHTGQAIEQGYLHEKGMTTRVRIIDDTTALLTLKGPRRGLSRDEFEYAIPLADAKELMAYCGDHRLTKTRYEVAVAAHVWHVDVYHGSLSGLVTAEVELTFEKEKFIRPQWVGTEVSQDKAFSNKNLARAGRAPMKLVA